MVQLVAGAVDYGDAAEVYVSHITRVSRISNNIIRITYCVEREGSRGVERRVMLHVLRDLDTLADELERLRQAVEMAKHEPPLDRGVQLAEWH